MTTSYPSGEGTMLVRDTLWRRHRRRLRRGGFKTVELNLAGWSALLAAGIVPGAAMAIVADVPAGVALPLGIVVTWAGFLVADHVRWRNGTVGLGFGSLDAETGQLIVAELARLGITASYTEQRFDDEDPSDVQRSIVCRNADAASARRVAEATLRLR